LVGWGRSFWLAIKATIFTVLWMILGGIIIAVGIILFGEPNIINYLITLDFASLSALSMVKLIVSVISLIIGWIIIMFGAMASLIKVVTDESFEEVYRRRYSPPPY